MLMVDYGKTTENTGDFCALDEYIPSVERLSKVSKNTAAPIDA